MLINSPNISGSLKVTGNTVITGSLTVLGGINATIQGTAATASYVQYTSVANKPTLVSGSSQISFTGITNKPTLVSGSGQISFNGITNKPALVSGSSQISYSGVSGKPSGIVSSSVQVRGYNIFATTGSNQFKNNQVITGSLTVTGQVVAQTLNVQQVTSSIVYSSGSNRFGNSLSNRQQFTGSVNVTGSMTVNGNVLLTTTDSLVATNTSDGSDNKSINISGGGTQSVGRGANLRLYGNEYSGEAGNAYIYTGNGANSNIVLNAYSSTSTIQLWTDNTERLRIISGGNVGIGTTTPAQKLQINGPLALSNLAEDFTTNQEYAYPIIYAGNLSGLGNGELVIQPRTTATRNIRFVTRSSGAVSGTNPDTRMIIRWDGNVGIGTTSPNIGSRAGAGTLTVRNNSTFGEIEIAGNASTAGAVLSFYGDTTKYAEMTGEFESSTNGMMIFRTRSSGTVAERMRITSGGLVGIGNDSPSANGASAVIDVGNGSGGTINLRDTNTGLAAEGFHQIYGGDNRMYLYAGGSGASAYMQFYTNDSERMRITSNGSLLVGTSSTTNTSAGRIINRTGGTSNPDLTLNNGAWSNASIGGEPALYLSSNIVAATGAGSSSQTAKGGIGFEYYSSASPTELSVGIFGTPTVASNLRFWNGSEHMRITSSGEILIGTTSDLGSYRLQVASSTTAAAVLSIQNTSASGYSGAHLQSSGGSITGHFGYANASTGDALQDVVYFGSIASKAVVFTTNDSEKIRITSGGNVGIGETNPSRKLQVNGTGLFSGTLSTAKVEVGAVNSVNITTNSTFTLIPSGNFNIRTNILVSVAIRWDSNANAQRQYLLFIGATDTGWGTPNSAISVIASNDWSSGYVGAASFSIGGSGQNRTLNISVSNAATYNVTANAAIVDM